MLREGPLEFFACFPGKEHESIIRLDAPATRIYQALGLIGLEPGHPPRWDDAAQRYEPAAGALVDLTVEWRDAGALRRAAPYEWLAEIDTLRPPPPRPWLFSGSVIRPDRRLEADLSGAGVALVDQSDALLSLSQQYSNANAELWVQADTQAIPPLDTVVTLVFTPAEPRRYRIELDWRGQWRVDGALADTPLVADLIGLMRRMRPGETVVVTSDAALRADIRRAERTLATCIPDAEAVRWVRRTAAASRPSR
ncbi:MAG: hypothetical protein D6744_03160 [Planctomycetota bacterium]|nr:MAG: hypothetical protein D6744_03160 [Planctomycetota bacterium]